MGICVHDLLVAEPMDSQAREQQGVRLSLPAAAGWDTCVPSVCCVVWSPREHTTYHLKGGGGPQSDPQTGHKTLVCICCSLFNTVRSSSLMSDPSHVSFWRWNSGATASLLRLHELASPIVEDVGMECEVGAGWGLGTGWEVPQLRGGGQACGNSFVTGVGFWDLGHLICVRFHICKASLTVSSRACPSCWLLSESTGQRRNGSVSLAVGPSHSADFCLVLIKVISPGLWPGVAGGGVQVRRASLETLSSASLWCF